MALKPAPHTIIVQPSLVDNDEEETDSGLHVVHHSRPARKVWRGVVEAVGAHINDGPGVGHTLHYTDFVFVEGKHVVPQENVMCWEDDW